VAEVGAGDEERPLGQRSCGSIQLGLQQDISHAKIIAQSQFVNRQRWAKFGFKTTVPFACNFNSAYTFQSGGILAAAYATNLQYKIRMRCIRLHDAVEYIVPADTFHASAPNALENYPLYLSSWRIPSLAAPNPSRPVNSVLGGLEKFQCTSF
jgi:hypothetical protein